MRDEFIQSLWDRPADTTVFVSSHDLGEIESVASHVGFLNAGRLQFAEETAALLARFREVEITGPVPPGTLSWPASWQGREMSPALVRFVETRFDERTASDIAQIFPGAARVAIKALSLRDIFVILAKAGRALAA